MMSWYFWVFVDRVRKSPAFRFPDGRKQLGLDLQAGHSSPCHALDTPSDGYGRSSLSQFRELQSEACIDIGEHETREALGEFLPHAPGLIPGIVFDDAAMREVAVEYSTSLVGEALVIDSDEQFVIDVQTPVIHVGGTDVYGVVDHDQLGMEDLGVIFENADSRVKEPVVQRPAGKPCQLDVRLAGRNDLHIATVPGNPPKRPDYPVRWQEVGGDNPYALRLEEIAFEELLDRTDPPARPACEQARCRPAF